MTEKEIYEVIVYYRNMNDDSMEHWHNYTIGDQMEEDGMAWEIQGIKVHVAEDICCECGKSVIPGSGRFVNRIPVLDSYATRVEGNRPYPTGEWVCGGCDARRDEDETDWTERP